MYISTLHAGVLLEMLFIAFEISLTVYSTLEIFSVLRYIETFSLIPLKSIDFKALIHMYVTSS